MLGHAVTALSALVLLALIALFVLEQWGESPLAAVANPERALAVIVGRTMDAHTALAGAPAWERRLYAFTLADAGSEIDQAIAWYEELADYSRAPAVDLQMSILLGEAGRREALQRLVQTWRSRGEPTATHASTIALAYLDGAGGGAAGVDRTLGALGPGWFADALALRLATPLAEPVLAERARRAIAARAAPLLWRLRALLALDLLLVVVGALALRPLRRRLGGRPTVAGAPLPPPWTMGAGLATLLRGGALGAIVLLVLILGLAGLAEQPLLAEALYQPLMFLPMLVLIARSLLAPAGLGFVAAFGLRLRPGGWRLFAQATLVLIAAGVVTDIGLGLLSDRLGLAAHWTEWFDTDLAWGPPVVVAVTLVGAVVFAPIFEELVFRGLLYGSLRARFSWQLAALGSGLVFGLAHGYGAAGFLSVLLSGLLWAYVYERTGSLLPCIVAHVVNNAAVALTVVALLR